jgi:predicted SAM-dependent methyltransferase
MVKKPLKLNLGCGSNKLPDYVNIDGEASCKPDVLHNILEKFPYKAGAAEEIVMFHCIEHIHRSLHQKLFTEIWRLLRPGGRLIISYPEFLKAVENWKTNYKGKKDFWENVIYGRQLYPGDAHVTIMHTPDFVKKLKSWGFGGIRSYSEKDEKFNTIISCVKAAAPIGYEDLIRKDMVSHKFKRAKI